MPGIPSIPGTGNEPVKLVNPRCALRIYGAEDILIQDLDIDFEISKDLDEEPNEATVTIHNLSEDTRTRIIDPSVKDTPIEILLTPFGLEDLIVAFVGEVDRVTNEPLRPGFITRLECSSQKWQHRALYVEQKTYTMGTPAQTIVDDFVKAINIPVNQVAAPLVNPILLAQSFTGPAFPLLQRFLFDYGRLAYILDGVLTITSSYTPPVATIVPIVEEIMLTQPQPIERTDSVEVAIRTVTETVGLDPLQKLTRKQKKKYRKKIVNSRWKSTTHKSVLNVTENDTIEVEAVDTVIHGIECELLSLPTMQPDAIVQFPNGNQYRVQSVNHFGNVSQGGGQSAITTAIEADDWQASDALGGNTWGAGF